MLTKWNWRKIVGFQHLQHVNFLLINFMSQILHLKEDWLPAVIQNSVLKLFLKEHVPV